MSGREEQNPSTLANVSHLATPSPIASDQSQTDSHLTHHFSAGGDSITQGLDDKSYQPYGSYESNESLGHAPYQMPPTLPSTHLPVPSMSQGHGNGSQESNGHLPSQPGQTSIAIVYTDDVATKPSDKVRRRCFKCGKTKPKSWRRSTLTPGKVLCNRCGLYEKAWIPYPRPAQIPRRQYYSNSLPGVQSRPNEPTSQGMSPPTASLEPSAQDSQPLPPAWEHTAPDTADKSGQKTDDRSIPNQFHV